MTKVERYYEQLDYLYADVKLMFDVYSLTRRHPVQTQDGRLVTPDEGCRDAKERMARDAIDDMLDSLETLQWLHDDPSRIDGIEDMVKEKAI
jgi:hypothetical protein